MHPHSPLYTLTPNCTTMSHFCGVGFSYRAIKFSVIIILRNLIL